MVTPHDPNTRKKKARRKKHAVQDATQDENGAWKCPSKMLTNVVSEVKKNDHQGLRPLDDLTDKENEDTALKHTAEVIKIVDAHETFARNGDSRKAKRNVCYRIMGNLFGCVNGEPLPDLVVSTVRAAHPSSECVGFKDF